MANSREHKTFGGKRDDKVAFGKKDMVDRLFSDQKARVWWSRLTDSVSLIGTVMAQSFQQISNNYTIEGAGTPDTPYDFMKRAAESIENGGDVDTRLEDLKTSVDALCVCLQGVENAINGIDFTGIEAAINGVSITQNCPP